jgi:cytoskeletal protein CcmA (bactofilin family)
VSVGDARIAAGGKATVRGVVKASRAIIGEIAGACFKCSLGRQGCLLACVFGDVRDETFELKPGFIIDGELRPLKNADKLTPKLAASNDT